MNKKIVSEIAIGIILILAIVVGVIFWIQNKIDTSNGSKIVPSQSEQSKQNAQTISDQMAPTAAVNSEPQWDLQENILYTIPSDHKLATSGAVGYYQEPDVYFSSDGKQYAYEFLSDAKRGSVSNVNGKIGGWISNIQNTFNNVSTAANLKKVMPTKVDSDYHFVYGGKDMGDIGKIPDAAAISGDGKQYAYVTVDDNYTRYVVMNGKKGSGYRIIGMQTCRPDSQTDTCTTFAFSYDGLQNAYIGQKGQLTNAIVINGIERESHREIHFPQFSFDSKHFAYKALDDKAFVVIDGKEQKKYDGVYNVKFNSNGDLTYNALFGDKILFVTQSLKLSDAPSSQSFEVQQSSILGNAYKNDKYAFTMQYPQNWKVDNNEHFAGPHFLPQEADAVKFALGQYDTNKDCAVSISFLQKLTTSEIPCKNKIGEIKIGEYNFIKCQMVSVQDNSPTTSYYIVHPKTGNLFSFDYINNDSCKGIFESMLNTLSFQ